VSAAGGTGRHRANGYVAGRPIGGVSVILEFTIPASGFQLGEVLSEPPGMTVELERIVPTGDVVMPFVWVTGEDQAAFAERVRAHERVQKFRELDRVGDSALYRVVWENPPVDLIEGIVESGVVVLEARGTDEWSFRLRFPDHGRLAAFHDYLLEHAIPVGVQRTYAPSETDEYGHRFGLSPKQREALVLALRRGYFETPSDVRLDELADELGISRQALSKRIRRAHRRVLEEVFLAPDAGEGESGQSR
jgi:predicted DNA binding protein